MASADIQIIVDSSQVGRAKSELDSLGLTVVKQTQTVQRLEKYYRLLDQAFNAGKISGQQYAKGIQQIDAAIESVQSGQTSLIATQQKLVASTQQATTAVQKQAVIMQQSQKANRQFELGLQQAGFQVGDFFVQIASGTNPMVAFTQQATQLVSFFGGPWGAVIGAALSIFGAVAIAMGATSEKTTQLTFDFQKFGQDMRVAIEPLMPIIRTLGEVFKFVKDIIISSINNILNALRMLGAAVGAVPEAFGSLVSLVDAQMFRLELVVKSYIASIKAAIQEMFDMISGSPAMITNAQGRLVSVAESYRQESQNYSSFAGAEAENIANMPGPGDVIGEAVSGVKPIDIGSYFSRTPVSGGGGGPTEDALQRLREQVALENELLGVSEAQKRVIQALGQDRSKYSQEEIAAITAEIEAYNQKLAVLEQQQQIADVIQSSMEDAFMSIVTGTESVADAFKQMAYLIIQELYKVLVVQQLVGSFNSTTGVGSGIVGAVMGAFTGGPSTGTFGLPKFASGGSIMPNQPYLVGEHGPELVIPRHSGTVVNANQTANAMGGSGGVTVQNNISVTGSDAAMVRAEVTKMIPQITNATKAAVIDARLRGGQMKAAFQ